jgi:predicted nucleotidyltransferase
MIDIEERYLAEIQRILSEWAPDCEVRAFGSRIGGNAEKYSDLDLVLVGNLDVQVLCGSDLEAVRREVRRCLAQGYLS